MRTLLIVILVGIVSVSVAKAEQVGDMNADGDGKIGLNEALSVLRKLDER